MRRGLAILLPLALVACQDSEPSVTAPAELPVAGPSLQQMPMGQQLKSVVPGEIIVKFKDQSKLPEVARANGLGLARMGVGNRFAVLQGARGSERSIAARLANNPHVEYAEPNYLRQPTGCQLWAFDNPGGCKLLFQNDANGRDGQEVSGYASSADADEDAAGGDVPSNYAGTGASVVISSLDTGVQLNHPEFVSGNLIAGRDWVNGDDDPSDDNGHGTHTTGTMVGQNVGVAGVAGAAANVKVLVQKVCGSSGCPTSAIVNAIYAAADYPGMVAMNLSLGGGRESKAEKDAISYAVNTKQVLVIASAGNDGTSRVSCPACDPYAISVAATNWQDGLAYYSNYGSGLDISAPGGEMYSNTTDDAGIYSSVPGGYAFYQGTSMAAPQVTGTAAVVASMKGLQGNALRTQIETSADDLGANGYDTTFGNGRVNTYRAATAGAGGGGGTEPPPDTCVPKGKGNNCK